MKSILLSIKPEWVAKILGGEKTIEIRKKFPKDYVGWVYIYCTKEKSYRKYMEKTRVLTYLKLKESAIKKVHPSISDYEPKAIAASGRVIGRFWCDKVDGIWKTTTGVWVYGYDYFIFPNCLEKDSCLTEKQLNDYFKPNKIGVSYTYGYAIHISKLEVFDGPRELYKMWVSIKNDKNGFIGGTRPLTEAPRNYCYIESEN